MNFKKLVDELREEYYKNNDDEQFFENTILFLERMYFSNESIKYLVDSYNKKALANCLKDGLKKYKSQFSSCTDIIIKFCDEEDYDSLTKYIVSVSKEKDYDNLDLEDPIEVGKLHMLLAFYKDVYDHKYDNIIVFANNCKYIENLYNMVNNTLEDNNQKSR